MVKALHNIRVLDFGQLVAGPYCASLLGELGAEVIKIETPESGETGRFIPPNTEGNECYPFIINNRGKRSVTLNLKTEQGREIAKKMIFKSDILIENFSFGIMDKLGLGYDDLVKIYPSLIYASITGFGHTGPRSGQAALDIIAEAMGGFMGVTGFPDKPPTKAGVVLGDYLSALYTTIAIEAAIYHRERTGKGQHIDISMQDCVWAIISSEHLPNYAMHGQIPVRYGNGHPTVFPYDTYPAKDGYVALATANVGQWEKLLKAIGRSDLIGMPKYTTVIERVKHWAEVDAFISDWTSKRTVNEVVTELNNANLPCSQIQTVSDVVHDPQIISRGMIQEIEQVISGKLMVPGSVFKMSATPGDSRAPAPFLGQHNHEVYSSILGYSDQEITELQERGII